VQLCTGLTTLRNRRSREVDRAGTRNGLRRPRRRAPSLLSMTLPRVALLVSIARRSILATRRPISRSMAKLTMFSLDAGRLVATPADPAVVAEPHSSVAAGPDAVASSSTSTTASTARSQVKVEDAALRAFGRRVSPRKSQTAVKYEEASDDDAALKLAARPPPRRTTLARQLTASKRPLEPSAIASSSKLGEGSPTSSRKPRTDAASSPKKARRSPIKGAAAGDDSAFTLDPPPRWREVYDEIKAMRANIVAPVDGMGCAAAGEREQDPIRSRFAVLVSLMLSSQTKGACDSCRPRQRLAARAIVLLTSRAWCL
jgi:hypothetical protein